MIKNRIIKCGLPLLKYLIPLKMPVVIALEASNRCFLNCITCPIPAHMQREKGDMSLFTFTTLLSQITWRVKKFSWAFGGEPLINKDIWQMIRLATDKGIASKVDTNGMLLHQYTEEIFWSNLKVLNVAFEGVSQESTSNFRLGYDYKLVMDNIRKITEKKHKDSRKHPIITLNYLVRKDNEDEIEKAIHWAQKLRIDYVTLKSINISPSLWLKDDVIQAVGSRFLPVKNAEFNRYLRRFGKWEAKDELSDFCRYIHNSVTITWDGTVLPCCFDFDATMACANIHNDTLRHIWRSRKLSAIRAEIYRKSIPICEKCTSVSLQKKIALHSSHEQDNAKR